MWSYNQPTNEPLHCVRCHATYTLETLYSCVVPHVFEQATGRAVEPDGGLQKFLYNARCCDAVLDAVGADEYRLYLLEDVVPRYCYVGRHTTDRRDVDQRDSEHGTGFRKCSKSGVCKRRVLQETEVGGFAEPLWK